MVRTGSIQGRWRETVIVLALLVVGIALRLPTLSGPLDRETGGFQAAAFTIMAINFERLGLDAYGGYGVVNIDLPSDAEATPYLYANHPPTVNLVAWGGLKAFAPAGWSERWRDGLPPPPGFEPAIRLPFFALHLVSLVALWWAVRQAAGPLRAALTLGVLVCLPISILYASLVNYENAYLPWTLFAVGFHVRWLRSGARRDLAGVAACLFLAGAITFGPAFFVAPLVLHAWATVGFRRALLEGAVASVAVLTPLVGHGAWVKHSLPAAPAENVFARVGNLIAPAFDGTMPIGVWLERNLVRVAHFSSWAWFALAVAGMVVALVMFVRGRAAATPPRFQVGWILLGGGALLFVGFYRHTFDGAGLYDAQTVFLVNLAPGIACFAALALERLDRLLPARPGVVAALLLVGVGALAQARTHEVARIWRAPGPRDGVAGGPPTPLPSTLGEELRRVLPERSLGLVPRELALTPATALYAWRTILPVDRASFPRTIAVARDMYRVGDLPRYLLLPLEPPEDARVAVTRERAALASQGKTPAAVSAGWELWALADR